MHVPLQAHQYLVVLDVTLWDAGFNATLAPLRYCTLREPSQYQRPAIRGEAVRKRRQKQMQKQKAEAEGKQHFFVLFSWFWTTHPLAHLLCLMLCIFRPIQ